jgi:hypothetical protein
LSAAEGIDSGGGRSVSRSGGHRWGWSGQGGTPWRRGGGGGRVGGVQCREGARGGRGLGRGLRLLAPSCGGSSLGHGPFSVARWCTWVVVFNGSSVQRRHGVALRRVFDGGSVGCGDDDLCREYGMVRHIVYGEHKRRGELW